jgi:ubiquitin-like 1-activating enzyme E1 B
MDTIETSNLNRQFLFRKRHVGSSKAQASLSGALSPLAGAEPGQVARESVLRFCPDAHIVAHFDNVKSEAFSADFVKRFDVVLNGLDNLEARRHVNRLCLAAGVPLVESGTAGYLGQARVRPALARRLARSLTFCPPLPRAAGVRARQGRHAVLRVRAQAHGEDVPGLHHPKHAREGAPAASRSRHATHPPTPRQPIHCIVWAKDMLFATLFGPKSGTSDLEEAEEAQGDEEDPAAETAEQRAERAAFFVRRPAEPALAFAQRIHGRAFGDDIRRLLRISRRWEKPGRVPPTPLGASASVEALQPLADASAHASACASLGLSNPQALWSGEEAEQVFLLAAARLAARQAAQGSAEAPAPLSFDKDDALAVEFVAAAAALRGQNYGIAGQSLFAAKGMAGNIIHAIATTNAIISGLIVLEALKLLRGRTAALRNVYLQQFPSATRKGLRLLMPEQPLPAGSSKCHVCGLSRLEVQLDLGSWTLGAFEERILQAKFGLLQPAFLGPTRDGCNFDFGEEPEDEEEAAALRSLKARLLRDVPGGLADGDVLDVSDQRTSLRFYLKLVQRTDWDAEKEPEAFLVQGEALPQAEADEPVLAEGTAAPVEEEDDLLIVEEGAAAPAEASKKRGREGGEEAGPSKKAKACSAADADDDVIIL